MRKIVFVSLLLGVLYADTLPLVHYDPFYKSQIILHSQKRQSLQHNFFGLSAIFNDRAFINNRFYTVGEKIQGYRIKKIYKHSVVLQHGKHIKVLRMQQKHFLQIKQAKRERK